MPGGNIFYFAPPGRGKSLRLAMQACAGLKYGRRKQFSNNPIVDEQGRSTFVWSKEMVLHGIRDSDIFWDEIQMDYDSGEVKTLPPEDDDFFATSGQCGNTVYCASQGLTRVTKGIRDRMNYFVQVEVVLELPGLRNARGGWFRPVIFRELWWENWEDIGKKDRLFLSKLFLFDRKSAMAYDTTWFAGKRRDPPKPITWQDAFTTRGGDNERFKEHINKIRSSGLWQVTKRFAVSQGRKIVVCYLNVSAFRRMLGTCQAHLSSVVGTVTQRVRPGIFQDSNKGRKRGGFSYLLDWLRRGPRHQGDTGELDQAFRGDTIGCAMDPEDPSVLPGTNPAAEVSPLQQFQGVALAWSRRNLEKDMPRADPLVQGCGGYSEDLLEPEDSCPEMAGGDPEGSPCEGCPSWGSFAPECLDCRKGDI